MMIKIDFDSETPIYIQVKNQIIIGVSKGYLTEGDELPSVRSLAESIGVNMHTVNKSYSLLKDEGYIKMDRRKGAFISIDLKNSEDEFNEKFEYDIRLYISEYINRNKDINLMIKNINDIYKEIKESGKNEF